MLFFGIWWITHVYIICGYITIVSYIYIYMYMYIYIYVYIYQTIHNLHIFIYIDFIYIYGDVQFIDKHIILN